MSLQAALTASAGVTDNVASEPTNPAPGVIGRQSDFLSVISPGLILSGGTPRAVQQLYYTFGGVLYGRHSEADTYTNTLGWRGLFLPTKTTTVSTLLSVIQGRNSAFNTAIASSNEPAQTQLSGNQNLLTVVANQTLSWEISALWQLRESAGYTTAYYLNTRPIQGITQAVPVTAALERRFQHSAMGLSLNGTYTQFFAQHGAVTLPGGSVQEGGVVRPQANQIIMTPTATYRRDLTYWMSIRAALGAAIVFDPTSLASHYFGPAGSAGINFNTRRALFDLSYSHLVVPNLLFGANFVSDAVAARGTFVLSHKYDIGLSLGLSYLYAQEVDLKTPNARAVVCTNTGTSAGGIGTTSSCDGHGFAHTVLGDATIGWNARPELQFFLRYQLIDQIGHESAAFPIPTYYRNTVLFGLTATYPAEPAVRVSGNSMGVRADHSDDAHIETSKSTQRDQN